MRRVRDLVALVRAVVARPRLWPTAARQWRRTLPEGWWRRAPYLPVPDRDYVRFRLTTHQGGSDGPVRAADVVHYLQWCRSWERAA